MHHGRPSCPSDEHGWRARAYTPITEGYDASATSTLDGNLIDRRGPTANAFSHPDYTVGSGFSPDLLTLCGYFIAKCSLLFTKVLAGLLTLFV